MEGLGSVASSSGDSFGRSSCGTPDPGGGDCPTTEDVVRWEGDISLSDPGSDGR